jgi:peptide/nickel transport system substrate-binding protein
MERDDRELQPDLINELLRRGYTRRDILKGAAGVAGAVTLGSLLAACGGGGTTTSASPTAAASPKKGGSLKVGILAGGTDTADPHAAAYEPDIAIQYQLYDGLTGFDTEANVINHLAEELTPNADATVWTCKLKPNLTWHDGKPVTADDVVYTFDRIIKGNLSAASSLPGLTVGGTVKKDTQTVEFQLKTPNAVWPEGLAFRGSQIVPVGFNPKKPIGCGPFKLISFNPGQQFTFAPFADYWMGEPYVDDLTIIEYSDATARVNALTSGAVQAISTLPASQVKVLEASSGFTVLNSETGAWRPFTMRIDVKPFSDSRVRQAFRLIVDRPQMIEQAYSGYGAVAYDMYARYDPGTPTVTRQQDLEQAKSLLKQAGYGNGLTVDLVTSAGGLGGDDVAAAQVFKEQAKGAGVTVNVKNVDSSIFWGDQYLSWPFAGDFWYTRNFLLQSGQATMPGAPYNETHWKNDKWLAIVKQAYATVDETKRNELVGEAQTILFNEGGYILWAWRNQVDACSDKIAGLVVDKLGTPLTTFGFNKVSFV